MWSKPVVLGVVVAGSIAAAGIGAYVAVRQNAAESPADQTTAPASQAGEPATPEGVAETEAVVTDERAEPEKPVNAAPALPPASTARPKREPSPKPRAPVVDASKPDASAAPAAPANGGWSGLERPWPTRPSEVPVNTEVPAVGEAVPIEPPPPMFEDLTIAADSVIGLHIETPVSTETAQIEDRVEARVTRDVLVGGKVAVPAGTHVLGSVTLVERGGKVKERARLGVRFHTLVMADATNVPIQTESLFREGPAPSQESVAKIGGGAAVGAILGAIMGGAKGAAIGGAAGAAGGTAATMAGARKPATLAAGTTVTVRLTSPATVTVER